MHSEAAKLESGQAAGSRGAPLSATAVRHLELTNFRCFATLELDPAERGLTLVTGPNGSGKTTVLEAIWYLTTLRSFRGASREALVRNGTDGGVLRGDFRVGERDLLVEAEVSRIGRPRVQLNRQMLPSRRGLSEAVVGSIFSPDDLVLVQGGPQGRRVFLDEAAGWLDPVAADAQERFERALRQRNALLRQHTGTFDASFERTLDVWDERLHVAGTDVRRWREKVVEALEPEVVSGYRRLSMSLTEEGKVTLRYRPSWEGLLREALARQRAEDLRRGATSVGPHHDELEIHLSGRESRQQASQGEQRCLALAMRLAVHQVVSQTRRALPVLLLDDVFSELDPWRTRALVDVVPAGQTMLTTASPIPDDLPVARVIDMGARPTGPGRVRDA